MPESTKNQAPIASRGWTVWRYFYNGLPRQLVLGNEGRSREACRQYKKAYYASAQMDEFSELAIEPVGGWETLTGDPLARILMAFQSGDISLAVAAHRIDDLYYEQEDTNEVTKKQT